MPSLLPLLIQPGQARSGRGPDGIPNVVLWTRADRPHPTAPQAVVLNLSEVAAWVDQSGRGNHLNLITPRPTYQTDVVTCDGNLLPSLSFDGIDDYLSRPNVDPVDGFSGAPAVAVHIAFRAPSNTDGTLFAIPHLGVDRDGISVSLIPGGAVGRITMSLDCGDTGLFIPTTMALPIGGVYDDGGTHAVSLLFDATAPTNNMRMVFDTVNIAVTLNTAQLFADSNTFTVGQYNTGMFMFAGELLEVIVQDRALESDRTTIYDYFGRKWCVGS